MEKSTLILPSLPLRNRTFFQTLFPFQRTHVLWKCFLNEKKTCHRFIGSLSIDSAELLLFLYIYLIKETSDVKKYWY